MPTVIRTKAKAPKRSTLPSPVLGSLTGNSLVSRIPGTTVGIGVSGVTMTMVGIGVLGGGGEEFGPDGTGVLVGVFVGVAVEDGFG
jgi:hypothetical protein